MFRFFLSEQVSQAMTVAGQRDGCTFPVLKRMKNGAESNKKAGLFS